MFIIINNREKFLCDNNPAQINKKPAINPCEIEDPINLIFPIWTKKKQTKIEKFIWVIEEYAIKLLMSLWKKVNKDLIINPKETNKMKKERIK